MGGARADGDDKVVVRSRVADSRFGRIVGKADVRADSQRIDRFQLLPGQRHKFRVRPGTLAGDQKDVRRLLRCCRRQ